MRQLGDSASWAVPATASRESISRKPREPAAASHIVFIVRDDDGQADLLFQTSDTTWQAYNQYGGNSLYVGGPDRPRLQGELQPAVHDSRSEPEDWVFNAEYPMVRFLESNGYNVAYATGVDTDRLGAAAIQQHRVFLSVGHDEYWSGAQRANVEAARSAGVNLAFFSGNEVFWKTRWENSISASGTPSDARQLQGNPRQRQDRSANPPGPARGATRGSVRPPMAAGPKMR